MSSGGGSPKVERKTVEKNRRLQMKSLCFMLSSLIPKDQNFSKDSMAQQDLLDEATSYIKHQREKIERLKERKEMVMANHKWTTNENVVGFRLPVVEVRHHESSLEVVLISSPDKKFMFHEVISILEEEGAEVVNANFSLVDDKIIHTIHSQVVYTIEASRVSARIVDLISLTSLYVRSFIMYFVKLLSSNHRSRGALGAKPEDADGAH